MDDHRERVEGDGDLHELDSRARACVLLGALYGA
jgi:hypothetical protein